MNIYDRFHQLVSNRINPTFDQLEKLTEKYPKLIVPINVTLIMAFPAWCALAMFINSNRNNYV